MDEKIKVKTPEEVSIRERNQRIRTIKDHITSLLLHGGVVLTEEEDSVRREFMRILDSRLEALEN